MTSDLRRDAATEFELDPDEAAGSDTAADAGVPATNRDDVRDTALPADEPEVEAADSDGEQEAWSDGFDPWPGRLAIASSFDGPLPGVEYASVAGRLVTFLVDALILGFLTTELSSLGAYPLLQALTGESGLSTNPEDVHGVGVRFLAIAIVSVGIVGAFAFTYFLKALRATPGQYLARMRTVNVSDGGQVGVAAAFFRWLLVFLPIQAAILIMTFRSFWEQGSLGQLSGITLGATAAWYVLLLIATAVEPRRRGLQDRLTGSIVVELE